MLSHLVRFLRKGSFSQVLGALPYSASISAASVLLVVLLQMFLQKGRWFSGTLLMLSALGLISALILAIILRWLLPVFPLARWNLEGLRIYLLAFQAGLLLLFIPAFLLVWRTPDEAILWYVYPEIIKKQWLFGLYWLSLLTFLVFPTLVRRMIESPFAQDQPNRPVPRYPSNVPPRFAVAKPVATGPAETPAAGQVKEPSRNIVWWGSIVAKILLAVLVARYFAGPPWHLERLHRGIDFHEQLHLGPLQALYKGQLIDVGPAATAYGPGSQFVTYHFMKLAGHFDIVSYREAGAFIHLVTTFVFCVLAFFLLGIRWGLLALLFGLAYSPLHFFWWQPNGTLDGFHGWGNGFRYLGAAVVVPTLAVLATSRWSRRFPAPLPIALGFTFGFFCWLSQENLSATILGGGALLAILWLTDTVPFEAVLKLIGNMLTGFVLVWIPVLIYYLIHGAVREFWRAYFLYPSTVFRGYSNNYWSSGPRDPAANVFHFMVLFVIAAGICTLSDLPGLKLRRKLDGRKAMFLGFLFALAASYPTSLFRSDSSHLMNTLIALPFVVALVLRDLPDWISARKLTRWALRIAFALFILYFFPVRPFFKDLYHGLQAPLARFTVQNPAASAPLDTRIPFQRATRYLCDEAEVCNGNVPMHQFLEEASAARELIGARKTYVEGFPGTYVGIVYFMLDLNPAPYLLDKHLMVINTKIDQEALVYFSQHVDECEAVIATETDSQEVKTFLHAHPDAKTVNRFLGQRPYYLYLAPAAT